MTGGRVPQVAPASANLRAIPRSIWALGFVSLFMDASSELIHSLLPVFMVSVLGASFVSVGLVEGIAEATASITKVFSGALSDYFRRRKLLTVIGHALAALTKPLFPLIGSVGLVLTARFIDRIGKGIRGAPRDALIADVAPPHLRGASYGLRQSLDTLGALLGPLLAVALMAAWANDIRAVLWLAVVPAVAAVVIVIFGVKEPPRPRDDGKARSPIRLGEIRRIVPPMRLPLTGPGPFPIASIGGSSSRRVSCSSLLRTWSLPFPVGIISDSHI